MSWCPANVRCDIQRLSPTRLLPTVVLMDRVLARSRHQYSLRLSTKGWPGWVGLVTCFIRLKVVSHIAQTPQDNKYVWVGSQLLCSLNTVKENKLTSYLKMATREGSRYSARRSTFLADFYRASAHWRAILIKQFCPSVCLSIRLSVRPWRSGITGKRLKILS